MQTRPSQVDDQLRPLSYFARRLGGHPSSWTRRIVKGVRTPTGVVKLRAVRLGSKWLTDQAAINDFLAAQTEAYLGPAAAVQAPVVRSPSARRQESEAAAKELERMGC